MARQEATWQWNPDSKQRVLFEEWKSLCIGILITAREGFHVRSIPTLLEDQTGEQMPLRKMGFPSISHFLYAMSDCIEVRTLQGQYYIFVKDHAVPEALYHVRDMVLKQAKDKSCKSKTGKIRRPTRNQSIYVPIHTFLAAASNSYNSYQQQRQLPNRPVLVPAAGYTNRNMGVYNGGRNRGGGGYRGGSSSYQNKAPSSSRLKWTAPNYQTSRPTTFANSSIKSDSDWSEAPRTSYAQKYTAPVRPRYIPGVADDDEEDEDYSDSESGFDVVSARPTTAVNDENKITGVLLPAAASPAPKPVVTPSFSLPAVTVSKSALPVEPEPFFEMRQRTQVEQAISSSIAAHKQTSINTNAYANLDETTHAQVQQPLLSYIKMKSSSTIHGTTEAIQLVASSSPSTEQQQDAPVHSNIDTVDRVTSNVVIKSVSADPSPGYNANSNISLVTLPNLQLNVPESQEHSKVDDDISTTPKIGYRLDQRNDLVADKSGVRLNYKLPTIRFPVYFAGGTKECRSFKVFLLSTKQSIN